MAHYTRAAIIYDQGAYSVILLKEPTDGVHNLVDWYKTAYGPGIITEEYKTIGTYKFCNANYLWSFALLALRFEWKTNFPKEKLFKILQQALVGKSPYNYTSYAPRR